MDVKEMLDSYHGLRQKLGILKFKIENFEMYMISAEKTIEGMTYTSPQGERVTTSGVSDKTARIALKYQNVNASDNMEHLAELEALYTKQKYELDMLEHFISLLKKELSSLMTDLVINDMTIENASIKYNMSRSSVNRHYEKAVMEIEKMCQELGLEATG
ncbi:MAG: hypothetical protein P4L59_16380 [Desulfosporosinus sp.]|nr:hypothetical protein [Desulfosporosinus sp.]